MKKSSNYFNYSLHERINRKFYLGRGHLMERLIDCTQKPEFYMRPYHCDNINGGRVYLTGESVVRRTGVAAYALRGYGKMIGNGDYCRPQEFPLINN